MASGGFLSFLNGILHGEVIWVCLPSRLCQSCESNLLWKLTLHTPPSIYLLAASFMNPSFSHDEVMTVTSSGSVLSRKLYRYLLSKIQPVSLLLSIFGQPFSSNTELRERDALCHPPPITHVLQYCYKDYTGSMHYKQLHQCFHAGTIHYLVVPSNRNTNTGCFNLHSDLQNLACMYCLEAWCNPQKNGRTCY